MWEGGILCGSGWRAPRTAVPSERNRARNQPSLRYGPPSSSFLSFEFREVLAVAFKVADERQRNPQQRKLEWKERRGGKVAGSFGAFPFGGRARTRGSFPPPPRTPLPLDSH